MADEKINKNVLKENKKQSNLLTTIIKKLSINNNNIKAIELKNNSDFGVIQNEPVLQKFDANLVTLGNIETGIEKIYKSLLNSLDFQKKLAADEALDKKEDDAEAAKKAKRPDQKIKTERRDDDESKWLGFGNLLALGFTNKLSDILKLSRFTPILNFIKSLPKLILFTIPKKLFSGLTSLIRLIIKPFTKTFSFVFSQIGKLIQKGFNLLSPKFLKGIVTGINTKILKTIEWFKSFGVLFNTIKSGVVNVATSITKTFLSIFNPKTWIMAISPLTKGVQSITGSITGSVGKIFEPLKKLFDLSFIKDYVSKIFKPAADFIGKFGTFFSKFGIIFKSLGKLALPLTIIIAGFKGIMGAIDGWVNTEGGIFNKIYNSLEGLLEGIIEGLLGWIPDLLGFFADLFGFDKAGKWLSEFNLNDWINPFTVMKSAWEAIKEFWKLITDDLLGAAKSFLNLKIMELRDPIRSIVQAVVPDPTKNKSATDAGYWALKAIPNEIIEYAWGKKLTEESVGMKTTEKGSKRRVAELEEQQKDLAEKIKSGEITEEEGKNITTLIEEQKQLEIKRAQIVSKELALNRQRTDEMREFFSDEVKVKELENKEQVEIDKRLKIEARQREIKKQLKVVSPKISVANKAPAVSADALSKPESTEKAMVGNKLADSSGFAAMMAPITNIINNHAGNTVTNTSQNINNNIAESTDNVLSGSAYAY